MFKVDNDFLDKCGLGALPGEQKETLLKEVYNTLEERVGAKLTDTMSDEQVDEFARFLEGDKGFLDEWFAKNDPNYTQDEMFKKMKQYLPEVSEVDVMAEYGAMKWLQIHRPDYPQVVKETLDEIGAELSANKDKILGQ